MMFFIIGMISLMGWAVVFLSIALIFACFIIVLSAVMINGDRQEIPYE